MQSRPVPGTGTEALRLLDVPAQRGFGVDRWRSEALENPLVGDERVLRPQPDGAGEIAPGPVARRATQARPHGVVGDVAVRRDEGVIREDAPGAVAVELDVP